MKTCWMESILFLVLSIYQVAGVCELGENPDIDRAIQDVRSIDGLIGGLAAMITTSDGYVYSTSDGPEDHQGTLVDPNVTLFRWASVSKSVVGVIAAFMDEEGLVDLDANIRDYYRYRRPRLYLRCLNGDAAGSRPFPGLLCRFRWPLPFRTGSTSLRMLLGHRGGIQHYGNGVRFDPSPLPVVANHPRFNTGLEWALRKFIRRPLVAIPGTIFSYSTFGFNLAAVVLEHASGMPFPELMKRYVSGPLGLCSLQPDYEWDGAPRRAEGFAADGSNTGSDDVSWKLGGGGMRSTLHDFGRYGHALGSDTVWMPESVRHRLFVRDPAYCEELCCYHLGLFQCYNDNGELVVADHGGAQQKTRTILRIYWNSTSGSSQSVAIMSNAENAYIGEYENVLRDIWGDQMPLTSEDGCIEFSNSTCS